MPAFLVKNMPPVLHERLRQEATRHHRSMNREVVAILEKELAEPNELVVSVPVFPSRPVTAAWVRGTTRSLRESR